MDKMLLQERGGACGFDFFVVSPLFAVDPVTTQFLVGGTTTHMGWRMPTGDPHVNTITGDSFDHWRVGCPLASDETQV